jgi:hypothetical protein
MAFSNRNADTLLGQQMGFMYSWKVNRLTHYKLFYSYSHKEWVSEWGDIQWSVTFTILKAKCPNFRRSLNQAY